ncbi:MAG: hypothetical protein GQ540_08690 [Lutibacter sp.]|uniref:hypothetical protein n=1 Tax=Lutibacter sp. TaxID=1925666 RepID=UPI0019DDE450|nr:hypothetical protein [Lutibacter sp.]NOR28587.1 hypothetical protein [Lutibacter sp.]
MKKIVQILIIVCSGLLLNSCYYDAFPEYEDVIIDDGTDNGGGGDTVISYQDDIVPLWGQCTGCHGGTPPTLSTNSFDNLLNGYVVAGDADASTLYKSLLGTGGVSLMPPGSAWNQTKINLVKDWINQGALNN